MATDPHKRYSVVGPGEELAPDYDRVAQALSDADLEDEIIGKRGESEYQLALLREADRRAKTPPEEPVEHARAYDADDWDTNREEA